MKICFAPMNLWVTAKMFLEKDMWNISNLITPRTYNYSVQMNENIPNEILT